MNKKIKVIELLSEISKGKNPIFRKHGGTYRNSVWTFIISYFDKKMTHEEIVDLLNSEVEILEDEEKIDIQELEDVNLFDNGQNFNDMPIIIKSYDDNFTNINNTINKLIQAVKRLDKKNK